MNAKDAEVLAYDAQQRAKLRASAEQEKNTHALQLNRHQRRSQKAQIAAYCRRNGVTLAS